MALFTRYYSRATVHGGTVHGVTIHEKLFLDFFGFVARVRARADNVFKGNVNDKRIVENTQNRINFINE